jgi:hypothetical protein
MVSFLKYFSPYFFQDPATKKELDVVSLPLMYDEDEEVSIYCISCGFITVPQELSRQILELLGTPHKNLVNIVDFSVHQVQTK